MFRSLFSWITLFGISEFLVTSCPCASGQPSFRSPCSPGSPSSATKPRIGRDSRRPDARFRSLCSPGSRSSACHGPLAGSPGADAKFRSLFFWITRSSALWSVRRRICRATDWQRVSILVLLDHARRLVRLHRRSLTPRAITEQFRSLFSWITLLGGRRHATPRLDLKSRLAVSILVLLDQNPCGGEGQDHAATDAPRTPASFDPCSPEDRIFGIKAGGRSTAAREPTVCFDPCSPGSRTSACGHGAGTPGVVLISLDPVSILVLLDHALRLINTYCQILASDGFMFRSLFSWITPLRTFQSRGREALCCLAYQFRSLFSWITLFGPQCSGQCSRQSAIVGMVSILVLLRITLAGGGVEQAGIAACGQRSFDPCSPGSRSAASAG